MNPLIQGVERAVSSVNRLGLWDREQTVWGLRMRSKTFDRWLYLWLHRRGWMGGAERAKLSALVRPGMTVVDVGSNIGLYTVLLAQLAGPTGRILSFEPDPEPLSLLRANCVANGCERVEAHNLALGSRKERLTLRRLVVNSGDNHLGSRGRNLFRNSVEIQVEALDGLFPGLRPDFVKLDVQGWELKALRGMGRILQETDGVRVQFEFWPGGLRRAGDEPTELYGFLRGLGLRIFSVRTGQEFDEASFLALAARVKGLDHEDILASRRVSPNPSA